MKITQQEFPLFCRNMNSAFAVIIFMETRMLLRLQCVRSYLYQPRNVIWGLYLEKVCTLTTVVRAIFLFFKYELVLLEK